MHSFIEKNLRENFYRGPRHFCDHCSVHHKCPYHVCNSCVMDDQNVVQLSSQVITFNDYGLRVGKILQIAKQNKIKFIHHWNDDHVCTFKTHFDSKIYWLNCKKYKNLRPGTHLWKIPYLGLNTPPIYLVQKKKILLVLDWLLLSTNKVIEDNSVYLAVTIVNHEIYTLIYYKIKDNNCSAYVLEKIIYKTLPEDAIADSTFWNDPFVWTIQMLLHDKFFVKEFEYLAYAPLNVIKLELYALKSVINYQLDVSRHLSKTASEYFKNLQKKFKAANPIKGYMLNGFQDVIGPMSKFQQLYATGIIYGDI
ncbi:hypothetical protein [Adoxophyes orana nucleopolyhedrovirus]|uniref:hypothetical protein n=1 Tax=Adoxophyes orana nucleopolyhedrovirus TaxID=542343 RepID=UPI0001829C3C|nr:hypothetical protein [Adoxophyes orana nucleopolyhedrovirus]ACF05401.1 hypothetical protein [Adoxophyes orana nucleopolyhedrovirus]